LFILEDFNSLKTLLFTEKWIKNVLPHLGQQIFKASILKKYVKLQNEVHLTSVLNFWEYYLKASPSLIRTVGKNYCHKNT